MKKRISIIIAIAILFSSITSLYKVEVKADFVSNMEKAKQNHDALVDYVSHGIGADSEKAQQGIRSFLAPLGFLVGYATFSEATFRDIFNSKNYGGLIIGGENATDQEIAQDVAEALVNNISFNGDNMTISPVGRQILNDYTTAIYNETGYTYVYSIDLSHVANAISSGEQYNAMRQFILENQVSYNCLWYSNGFTLVPKNSVSYIYSSTVNNGNYSCVFYNNQTGIAMGWSNYQYYAYNNGSFNAPIQHTSASQASTQVNENKEKLLSSLVLSYSYELSVGESTVHQMFKSYEAFSQYMQGLQPYYTSSGYNNYYNSNGSFTVSPSNCNNVTYGDVQNYVNSFNTENGTYPTPTEVNVYIDSNPTQEPTPTPTPTPNPDDPSGGGGSGTGTGDTGIFDFLSRLGEVLGNLIKNLGEMLTSLIDGIVETVSSVLESIPNIFTPLIDYVFGGLPTEVRAMIILGISCMVIIGIVKAFKG